MGIFSKLTKKKSWVTSTLSKIQKEQIIAMRDEGYMPLEIAEEMKLDSSQISKVLELERRKKNKEAEADQDYDPVSRAKKDLAAAKVELEAQRLSFEREKLQAQIDEFKQEGEEETPDQLDPTSMILMSLFQGMKRGSDQQQPFTSPIQPQQTIMQYQEANKQDLTEEQILEILKEYKPFIKKFRHLDDDSIIAILKTKFEGFTEETYKRALGCIKKIKV